MVNENDWWIVNDLNEKQTDISSSKNTILATSQSLDFRQEDQVEKDRTQFQFDRQKEIVTGGALFLIGLFGSWNYWGDGVSGLTYISDILVNISWFLEYNYLNGNPGYYRYSLVEQIGWLIFILSPMLLTINVTILMFYHFVKNIDIGRTTSYIHFSIFASIVILETVNWGVLPFPTNYGRGFVLILLSGIFLNPKSGSKLSEIINQKLNT